MEFDNLRTTVKETLPYRVDLLGPAAYHHFENSSLLDWLHERYGDELFRPAEDNAGHKWEFNENGRWDYLEEDDHMVLFFRDPEDAMMFRLSWEL